MTPSAVSDAHAAIWRLNADPRLSSRAKAFIDEAGAQGQPMLISTITLIEVVYLQEKGKIPLGSNKEQVVDRAPKVDSTISPL